MNKLTKLSTYYKQLINQSCLYLFNANSIQVCIPVPPLKRLSKKSLVTLIPLLREGGVAESRGGRINEDLPILLYMIDLWFTYHLPLWGLLLPEGGEFR